MNTLGFEPQGSHERVTVESIIRAVAQGCGSILAKAMQGYGLYSGDGIARLCSLFLALF